MVTKMRKTSKFQGIFPAFYGCYEDDGSVSPERVKALCAFLLEKGVHGLYVCGSSGDCIYQTVAERKLILESVMEAVGGKIAVIAHVAANSIAESRQLAEHAEGLGVDAIASIPPIYFHLPEEGIARYWNAISEAAPRTSFVIYNIPQLAGVALTPSLLREMLKNPNVIGVKNSSMPVLDIQQWKMIGGDDFVVFNGPDEQYLGGRVMGADAGIGGTYGVMPELYVHLDGLIRHRELDRALKLQMRLNRLITLLCSGQGCMNAVIRQVLKLRGVNIGPVRSPMQPASEEDETLAREIFQLIQRTLQEEVAA